MDIISILILIFSFIFFSALTISLVMLDVICIVGEFTDEFGIFGLILICSISLVILVIFKYYYYEFLFLYISNYLS